MHRRAARLGPDRADRLVGDDAEAEEGDGHDEPEGEDAALEDEAFEGVEPRGPGVWQRVQSDEREGREPESWGAGASYGVLLSGNLYLVLPPGLTKRQFDSPFKCLYDMFQLPPCPQYFLLARTRSRRWTMERRASRSRSPQTARRTSSLTLAATFPRATSCSTTLPSTSRLPIRRVSARYDPSLRLE